MRLALLAVLLVLVPWTPAHAQAADVDAGAPAAAAQGWDFDEEEEETATWADDIRAQAVDLVAVGAFQSWMRRCIEAVLNAVTWRLDWHSFVASQNADPAGPD